MAAVSDDPGPPHPFWCMESTKFSVLFPFFPCRIKKRGYIILFKMNVRFSIRKTDGFPAPGYRLSGACNDTGIFFT